MTERTSQLLTVAEVAEWLRVEPRYVYRLASSGELIRVYIGRYVRIPAVSVEAYRTRIHLAREWHGPAVHLLKTQRPEKDSNLRPTA